MRFFCIFGFCLLLGACARSGSGGQSDIELEGRVQALGAERGELEGWLLLALDPQSQGQLAVLGQQGRYSFDLAGGVDYGFALLSKDYTLRSTLLPGPSGEQLLAQGKQLLWAGTENPPESAADLDGDGLLGVFDTDDDGDGIIDVLDVDSGEDRYFSQGLEWIVASLEFVARDSLWERYLTLAARPYPGVTGVRIRLEPEHPALAEAKAVNKKSLSHWDGTLLLEDDGVFLRKLSLGLSPGDDLESPFLPGQVLLFQIDGGIKEFPLSFSVPEIKTFSSSYDAESRTIDFLDSTPFAEPSGYFWTVGIYELAAGSKIGRDEEVVYYSEAISGAEDSFQLPEGVLVAGKKYFYRLSAQTHAQVPLYPAYRVKGDLQPLE